MQETVRFAAGPAQRAITRDGQPALISQRQSSLVMIRPAARRMESGERPVFVVALRNLTGKPLEFRLRDVAAMQVAGNASVPLQVFTYDELVEEERSRQIGEAVLAGFVAGASTALAAQEGTRTRTTTVESPEGSYSYETTTYSRYRATRAMSREVGGNARMFRGLVREGDAALDALERDTLKDNTLLPGEWYGGLLHIQPPAEAGAASGAGAAKSYTIALAVGPDRHEIAVVQEGVR
jgi:hypothetical protein